MVISNFFALSISHLETEIIMECNTNSQHDIDSFKEKYGGIKIFLFSSYIWDTMKMIVCFPTKRNDVTNPKLWDTTKIKYINY